MSGGGEAGHDKIRTPGGDGDVRFAPALSPGNPDGMYVAAVVHTQRGEKGKGLDWLKKALATGASAAMTRNDPALDSPGGMKDFPSNLVN
jgi:hypothetical protein